MGPAERARLNKEVASKLGFRTRDAWYHQMSKEDEEAKRAGEEEAKRAGEGEFYKKSPAAKKAWEIQEEKESMIPNDLNKHPDAMNYEHEFMRKTPAMRSIFGENPAAPAFTPKPKKGGKKYKTKKMKKSKRNPNKKTKAKKSYKKRATRRYRR